nr:MAG TPA: hypothetical protein [Caudoviricetes sp.]
MLWHGRFDSCTSFSPFWGIEKNVSNNSLFNYCFLQIFFKRMSLVRFHWDS